MEPAHYADEHLHVLSLAATRRSVDVRSAVAPTLGAALDALRTHAATLPPGTWIRAWGLDDAWLPEDRGPTRDELDAACPDHPVVVHHRSGHAEYRNSLAIALGDAPALDLHAELAGLGDTLMARGVVSLTDATPTNGPEHVELFRRANLPQHVTVMPGVHRLDEIEAAGYGPGWAEGRVAVGHAKVMAAAEEIPALIARAHARGWPAAVHVDDIDMVEAVIDGLEASPGIDGVPDRIEHLSLSLPEQVARLASLRRPPVVVTQPSFLRHRAHKYRTKLSTVEQAWLYRVRSLLDAGIDVRFSSDAPVVPCEPAEWIAAAVDRQGLADDEAVDEATARACCELRTT